MKVPFRSIFLFLLLTLFVLINNSPGFSQDNVITNQEAFDTGNMDSPPFDQEPAATTEAQPQEVQQAQPQEAQPQQAEPEEFIFEQNQRMLFPEQPSFQAEPQRQDFMMREEPPQIRSDEDTQKLQAVLEQPKTSKDKITLDIQGMDIVDVLKLLANQGNLNIIAGRNVAGRVSMFLKDVSIWDAFEMIVAANGLAYQKRGDIIQVMNANDYELETGQRYNDTREYFTKKLEYANAVQVGNALAQIHSAVGKVVVDEGSNTIVLFDMPEVMETMKSIVNNMDQALKPIEVKVFDLDYAEAEKLKDQFAEILTKNIGILKTDARTNKIVVVDYPEKLEKIGKIIKAFDSKTKQVLIEAKIIQVNLSNEYNMGIDWKYIASKRVNFTAFNINRALDTAGSQVLLGSVTPVRPGDFKVIIDMLSTFGDVKTLSTPRILATNGQEAKILVGSKQVYVSNTVVQNSTSETVAENVNFVDVGIKLYVTPKINNDGYISLKIRPEVSSAPTFFTKQDGTKIPIVDTSEAETSLLIKDGITVIMGGLMKNERSKTVNKLPLLGDIPLLGNLFKRTEDSTEKSELVIFITPHIVSGDESMLENEEKSS